ncbi:unnamed protein product [Rangifer tarandus platyrhynchus]|uniref:Uncharacterized protein n=2 Tax=Rangifer tarandus platyrhynchus TaxID=3082113 RepID=A0ACB0FGV5_RANTA|nr:unnamed protein product [Rangifer tarandus platyrhynchus]CAI9712325.1 unnamed protein product [Rangifer tarandus platyrhynchus]
MPPPAPLCAPRGCAGGALRPPRPAPRRHLFAAAGGTRVSPRRPSLPPPPPPACRARPMDASRAPGGLWTPALDA